MSTETRPLRILHLSDTHLFGDDTLHYGVVDTAAALRRVLERAAELDAIDLMVLSGDLSDDGSPASYRLLRELIDPWAEARGAAVVYAMGNHDLRTGFEQVLGERRGVVTVRGVRVIHLDSSVPGFGYGDLDDPDLAWLRAELAAPSAHGTVVVLHHPPVPASTPLLAALELNRPDELLRACAAGDVRLILSGHYHHSLATVAHGISVVVAPGITNTSDAIAPHGRERATVGSGFAIIELPVGRSGDAPDAAGKADQPRVTFITAPGPQDGIELFDLGQAQIDEIAAAAGKPAGSSPASAAPGIDA